MGPKICHRTARSRQLKISERFLALFSEGLHHLPVNRDWIHSTAFLRGKTKPLSFTGGAVIKSLKDNACELLHAHFAILLSCLLEGEGSLTYAGLGSLVVNLVDVGQDRCSLVKCLYPILCRFSVMTVKLYCHASKRCTSE